MATHIVHPAESIESIDTSRFECVDGQLVERPVPTRKHSRIQHRLSLLLDPLTAALEMECGPELSVDKITGSGSDWMTADFAVSMRGGYVENQNGHVLPPVYLVVEVLSPGQTLEGMEQKAKRYLAWGAQHVWIVDPSGRRATELHVAADACARSVGVGEHLTADSDFSVPLDLLFI